MPGPVTLKDALPVTLFVIVAGFAGTLAWSDLQRLPREAPSGDLAQMPAPESSVTPATDTSARDALPELALFGTAEQSRDAATPAPAPPPPTVDEAALPPSTAGYELFGIIEASDAASARAIIGTPDGQQQEYAVGDTMPDGARVHAIRERAVLFDRAGALERLALPALDSGDGGATASAATPPGLPGARRFRMPRLGNQPNRFAAPPPVIEPMAPTDVPPPPPDVPMADEPPLN